MVHEGNPFPRKYAKHQPAGVISRQTEIKMNVTNPEAIMAFDGYQTSAAYEKAAPMRAPQSKSWRKAGQPVQRTANRTKNKYMALTKLKSRKRRASNVNKGMIKEAKKLGKKRRREGSDDKSAILAKSERREAKEEAKRAAATKNFTAADAIAGSAACDPLVTASIATGLGSYLDLTKTKQSCGFGAHTKSALSPRS